MRRGKIWGLAMMLFIAIFTVFLANFCLANTTTAEIEWPSLKINEVVVNPASGNEWVEIYNPGKYDYQMIGWQICDSTNKSCKIASGTVKASGWLVVDLQTNKYLNNDKDTIVLKTQDGAEVDKLIYGEDIKVPDKGQSAALKKDGVSNNQASDWAITDNITPGRANEIPELEIVLPAKVNNTSTQSEQTAQIAENNNSISANITNIIASANSTTSVIVGVEKVNTSSISVKSSLETNTSSSQNECVCECGAESVAINSTSSKSLSTTGYLVLSSAKQAYGLEKGDKVKITGWVSVLPGIFGTQYFYITDGVAGVAIYSYKKDFPKLVVGDQVEVSGEITEINKLKMIKTKEKKDIVVLGKNKNIAPIMAEIGQLSENIQGGLVKVSGDVTAVKSSYVYLDDGQGEVMVYFKTGAGINKKVFKTDGQAEAIGILQLVNDIWQVWPRGNSDIKILNLASSTVDNISSVTTTEKNVQMLNMNGDNHGSSKKTASRYLLVIASGLLLVLVSLVIKVKADVLRGWFKKLLLIFGKSGVVGKEESN